MTKYKAIRTNGYASKKEAQRASELYILERLGHISDLEKQKRFVLVPKDEMGPAINYVCDFWYFDVKAMQWVCEDVKSEFTAKLPLYRLKKRLMFTVHNIKITEIR